jgi:hypothetical protein
MCRVSEHPSTMNLPVSESTTTPNDNGQHVSIRKPLLTC